MAEQLVYDQVVKPVVESLFEHITKHIGYAACTTKHVSNMNKKWKILENKSTDVNNHKKRNDMNNKEIPTGITSWLKDVEDLKEKVERISSDDIGCSNMKMRYRVGKKACEAVETIQELLTQEKEFIWTDALIPTGRVDASCFISSSLGGKAFKSRDKTFNDALKFLQQDDTKSQVIALCGMGGIGKTTMMEQLRKVAYEKKMFDWIVKVAIGKSPNVLSIQDDIAIKIGGGHLSAEKNVTDRADSLYTKFKKVLEDDRETILVILDDVWEKFELKNIGLTSPLPNGVRLMITSRDSRFCTRIVADVDLVPQVVEVNVLEEIEAHDFFFQIARVSEKNDPEKYRIGCDIVKKCGCLPLAIDTIAKALISQECYAWSTTLNRLKYNEHDEIIQEVISISYDYIKVDEEKNILLHCGLFPEDSNISIEDLTRHAWGLKLLKNVSTLRDARNTTKTCVSNLIKANLLMNSDCVGCVKMHDLVLAFVLNRVSKDDQAWIIKHDEVSKWGEDETSKSYERISLTCRGLSEFPRDFKYPNLSHLQLMQGDMSLKFREDTYDDMKNLKVIVYYKMQYPLLPRSLTNLKTLCLNECELFLDFSCVGDLKNLEVLSFAGSGIRKLTSMIGNLTKLKLLDLTGCVELIIDDGVFKKLNKLEELYMSVCYEKAIRFTDANFEELETLSSQLSALEVEFVEKTQLKNMSFKKLDKFKISMGCFFEKEKDNEKYSSRNTLKLVASCSDDIMDCRISELFEKTDKLHLQVADMIRLENVVSLDHYNQQYSFSKLRDLVVTHCEKLQYLFPVHVASGLMKLERLKVSKCSVLEALVNGSEISEMIKFEELKFMCLEDLPQLVGLFLVDVELPQLAELKVVGLPKFTSIYHDENNTSELEKPLFNSQVKVSKLEKLRIEYMENLKQIWGCSIDEDVNSNSMSMLREIWVEKCDSVVNLFPTNPMRLFNRLERLEVEGCGSIEVIFNIELECVGHEAEQISTSSLRDIRVVGLKNLREVWRIKGGENNSSSSIQGFEAVERIYIRECDSFGHIFTPTNIKFDMPALKEFSIYACGGWKEEMEIDMEKYLGRKRVDSTTTTIGVAFSSNLIIHTFRNLHQLWLQDCKGVEVVFEIESPHPKTNIIINQQQQHHDSLLPNLQRLDIWGMESMSHLWKCSNWNYNLLKHSSIFHNLTTIFLENCKRITYLFSPLMAKLLYNLKEIRIIKCDGMEEVVSKRDDKDKDIDDEDMTTTTTTFFPHLHLLRLSWMRKLKRIGGGEHKISQVGVVSWSICQYPREINIYGCNELLEVFETDQEITNNSRVSTNNDGGNGGIHNTSVVSTLQNINVPQLSNLKKLEITRCNLLQHVFLFSTLESLTQLEDLVIKSCKAMEVIVKEEKGMKNIEVVKLPRLKSLELFDLQKLKGFFLGMNGFEWPSLEKLLIKKCPQMKVFTQKPLTAPQLKYIHTSLGRYSFECGLNFHVTTNMHQSLLPSSETAPLCSSSSLEPLPNLWSFHNLIELDMQFDHNVKCIIPFNELLHQLQKLERIHVYQCESITEVFSLSMEVTNSGFKEEEEEDAMKGTINSGFPESQTVVEITKLREVELIYLKSLEYIWKISNHHVLKFPNLTTLFIHNCERLEHVFTSSMVGSLPQLQDLQIWYCSNMDVIVREEGSSCDAKLKDVVMFPCLKSLKLEYLESLKGFCLGKHDFSWPSLDTLEIIECPKMTVFTEGKVSTPTLNIFDTSFGKCDVKDQDLNTFIKTKHQEGYFDSRR